MKTAINCFKDCVKSMYDFSRQLKELEEVMSKCFKNINIKGDYEMKKVKLIDDNITRFGYTLYKIYDASDYDDVYYSIIDDKGRHCVVNKCNFKEIKPDKIELLSKNGFELINGNFRYYLYLETNINKFNELEIYYRYDNNERIIHQIRWGKVYNTTFNDIKSVLDALNIEIIEAPKYTIDSSKEYTEEEMLKLSELGVKFKEI